MLNVDLQSNNELNVTNECRGEEVKSSRKLKFSSSHLKILLKNIIESVVLWFIPSLVVQILTQRVSFLLQINIEP